MKTTFWRWATACALATGCTLGWGKMAAAATKHLPTKQPRAAEAVLAFERGLHQAVVADDSSPSDNPFADDPVPSAPAYNGPASPYYSGSSPAAVKAPIHAECTSCSSSCGSGGCGTGGSLLAGSGMGVDKHRGWARLDYLLWWTDGQDLPALVTTSPTGTPQADAGELPGATILFGNERVDDNLRSGGRLELGMWLDDCQHTGIAGRFFALGGGNVHFDRSANGAAGSEIIGRPFFDVSTNQEAAFLVAFPGLTQGAISVDSSNDVLVSDIFLRRNLFRGHGSRLDLVGGYFFSRVDESLDIHSSQTVIGGGGFVPVGTQVNIFDSFSTENEFHGGEIGFLAERSRGLWSLRVLSKVALGNMNQRVRVAGSRDVALGGAAASFDGGLLSMPSNIGEYERNDFAVVPEVDISLGYKVGRQVELTVGYSFVYWSDVVRPGDVIDRNLNLSQANGNPLAGDPRPEFRWSDSDFWAQGLNFGLRVDY